MSQVIWDESAYDELADIWVQATPELRDRIEAAVHRANAALRADPLGEGESRAGDRRLVFYPPLAVLYRVSPDGSVVHVQHVARYSR
jgi:plasmid stabilization system protein ParE